MSNIISTSTLRLLAVPATLLICDAFSYVKEKSLCRFSHRTSDDKLARYFLKCRSKQFQYVSCSAYVVFLQQNYIIITVRLRLERGNVCSTYTLTNRANVLSFIYTHIHNGYRCYNIYMCVIT